MIGIALAKEPATSIRGFKQHSISARIRRTISNAVLYNVNVNTRPQGLRQALAVGACHNLFNREILGLWFLPVKERNRNPNFVGNLNVE